MAKKKTNNDTEKRWVGVGDVIKHEGGDYQAFYLNFYRDVKLTKNSSLTFFAVDHETELARLSELQEEGKISADADIEAMASRKQFQVAIDMTRENNEGVEVL